MMGDWLKAMVVPTLVLITVVAVVLSLATIQLAPMAMYDYNFEFKRSLTAEQKDLDHSCEVGQMVVFWGVTPLLFTTAIWLVAFFVQRRRNQETRD